MYNETKQHIHIYAQLYILDKTSPPPKINNAIVTVSTRSKLDEILLDNDLKKEIIGMFTKSKKLQINSRMDLSKIINNLMK